MTRGGPSNATLFYMLSLHNNAFGFFKMGYATAMTLVLFIVIVLITVLQSRVSRLWVFTEEG